MATASVNGVRLDYDVQGTGPPLVLVHGSWGDRHNWDAVLPGLARHFRVVAYSRRGHSESTAPPGPGSIAQDAEDALALPEVLGLAPCFVAGNSFGSIVALRAAMVRPAQVRALMVHEPPLLGLLGHDPPLAPVLQAQQARIGEVLGLLQQGQDEAGAREFVEQVAMGPGTWATLPPPLQRTFVRNAPTWVDEMREREAFTLDLPRLADYRGPALLTNGDASPPWFRPILDRVAAALPQAVRHTYPGAGHAPHVTHPAAFVACAGEFFLKGG